MILSDEELVALGADVGCVVLPFLDGCDAAEQEAAGALALRGLALRGLLRPGSGPPVARAVLRRLLEVRAVAEVVVCARREPAGGEPECAYWQRAGRTVVEELVSADGFHRLLTCRPEAVPARAGRWLLAAPGPTARADLVVRRLAEEGARPELLTFLLGPGGIAVVRSRRGAGTAGPQTSRIDRAAALDAVRRAVEEPACGGGERQWPRERPP